MKTGDFLRKHNACWDGAKWALSISDDMSVVWDAMIKEGKHEWLIWTATRPGVFSDTVLRKLACRFVRDTPICDGTVWDFLADERSRKAVEVAELYADGKATDGDLADARNAAAAAYAAADAAAAYAAAFAVAFADADAAAHVTAEAAAAFAVAFADADASAWAAAAARIAADAAAKSAQVRMIAELGNPFNKEA